MYANVMGWAVVVQAWYMVSAWLQHKYAVSRAVHKILLQLEAELVVPRKFLALGPAET